jgi:hypothetical protein
VTDLSESNEYEHIKTTHVDEEEVNRIVKDAFYSAIHMPSVADSPGLEDQLREVFLVVVRELILRIDSK